MAIHDMMSPSMLASVFIYGTLSLLAFLIFVFDAFVWPYILPHLLLPATQSVSYVVGAVLYAGVHKTYFSSNIVYPVDILISQTFFQSFHVAVFALIANIVTTGLLNLSTMWTAIRLAIVTLSLTGDIRMAIERRYYNLILVRMGLVKDTLVDLLPMVPCQPMEEGLTPWEPISTPKDDQGQPDEDRV